MPPVLGTSLLILGLILFLGWYAFGTQFNVRRGNEALKWLQKGLPALGEKATLRWLGSSVVEVKVNKAKEPFRSAELVVALEPRDVPFLWWWGHMRGRRDIIIIRGQLRSAPGFDLEVRAPKSWPATNLQQATPKWTAVQGGVGNNMAADYRGQISPFSINRLIVASSVQDLTLTRLAVRRTVPNLEIHFLIPPFDKVPPQRVFSSLKDLADQLLKA